jgi:hypothetical protein
LERNAEALNDWMYESKVTRVKEMNEIDANYIARNARITHCHD